MLTNKSLMITIYELIIVSHRISAVRHADKIIVLENGEVLNIGTHDELLKNCKWYRELDAYQNKEVE